MLQLPLQREACLPSILKTKQNRFNQFVIYTQRTKITYAFALGICCYVFRTKRFLFVVSCHSIGAWKLALLFEVVFWKDSKYISGSFDVRKSSCSTSKDGGKKKKVRKAVQHRSLPWRLILLRLPLVESALVPVLCGWRQEDAKWTPGTMVSVVGALIWALSCRK